MDKKGFTLVELLISIAVGMVIMLAVYAAMQMAQQSSTNVASKITTQQDVRSALDLMAMEIRMASYNPRNAATTWATIPACSSMGFSGPVTVRKGIQLANRNAIIIAMDLNASGVVGDTANEYLMYSYDGAATITRNVSCGGNMTFIGGTGTDTNIRNAAAGLFPFRYFDRQDIDITTTVEGDQSQIRNIRRILITMAADTEEVDTSTRQPRRMIYSTNIIVRNHVLSP